MIYTESDFQREVPKEKKQEKKYRAEFWKDYARVLHSPSFRRLTGKTQLFPGIESDFYRNRLTHSLEVAQIGKSISNRLNFKLKKLYKKRGNVKKSAYNYINPELVEFACLAHDLGHAPFGHQGEEALNEIMKKYGGFEGNAQTLRIITKLEKREQPRDNSESMFNHLLFSKGTARRRDLRVGLNVTYRSIASILKYDEMISIEEDRHEVKKGYYKTEENIVAKVKAEILKGHNYTLKEGEKFKTIECQIMDIADDISYSIYDMEDAFKAGFFHPAELYSISEKDEVISKIVGKIKKKGEEEKKEHLKFVTNQDLKRIIAEIFDLDKSYSTVTGDNEFETKFKRSISVAKDGFFRSKFTSNLANEFIESVGIILHEECPPLSKVTIAPNIELKIEVLKHLTYQYQIKSPKLKAIEFKGKNVVKKIFTQLIKKGGEQYLPSDFRDVFEQSFGMDDAIRKRIICDFIACMTDAYALEFHNRLFTGSVSMHKPYN